MVGVVLPGRGLYSQILNVHTSPRPPLPALFRHVLSAAAARQGVARTTKWLNNDRPSGVWDLGIWQVVKSIRKKKRAPKHNRARLTR